MITNNHIEEILKKTPGCHLYSRLPTLNTKTIKRKSGAASLIIFGNTGTLIEVSELEADNYVHISIANLYESKLITGGGVLDAAISMGILEIPVLKKMDEQDRLEPHELFLSHKPEKTAIFNREFLALKLLYPMIHARGLLALENGEWRI